MKKFLFSLAAFAVVALSAGAQQKVNMAKMIDMDKAFGRQLVLKNQATPRPKKAKADNVYYTRQPGTLCLGWDEEWRGFYISQIHVPAFSDVVLTNMCEHPNWAEWYMKTSSGEEIDLSEYVDDEYNLVYPVGCYDGYYTYIPRIRDGAVNYSFGETGEQPDNEGIEVDSIGYKSFINLNGGTHYAFGAFGTGYLFGTGGFTPTDDKGIPTGPYYTSEGFVQEYPAPLAPLYVERISFYCLSAVKEPISDDASLRLRIMRYVYDDEGNQVGTELIKELTATKDDLTDIDYSGDNNFTTTGKHHLFTLTFSDKVVDELGFETEQPFVLDGEFALVCTGFENEGVDLGLRGIAVDPEDDILYGTYALAYSEDGDSYNLWYGHDFLVNCCFYGGYDNCEVETSVIIDEAGNEADHANCLQVSADGKTIVNLGAPDVLDNAVLMTLAYPWLDFESESENYYPNEDIEELPDWIYGIEGEDYIDPTYGRRNGYCFVTVECSALPQGVEGRYAKIYLQGKGYTSKQPIIVGQGKVDWDAIIASGVESIQAANTTTNSRSYNLAGQLVNKGYKGLVMKNGKKFWVK